MDDKPVVRFVVSIPVKDLESNSIFRAELKLRDRLKLMRSWQVKKFNEPKPSEPPYEPESENDAR